MESKKRMAVFVSGGGTNLQALINSIDNGIIQSAQIACVISNKKDAFALERARKAGIPCAYFTSDFEDSALEYMKSLSVDFIVLAGFLSIIGQKLLSAYKDKIINIHPSLIPSFCGKG